MRKNDYAKAAASVTGGSPVPEKASALCCVSGCCLPGTSTSATLGTSDWYCRLHFGSTYADQAKITALASNRLALYRLAFRCINVPPSRAIPPELVTALKRHDRGDLLNATPAVEGRQLTVQTLGRHMMQVLDAECHEPQQRIAVESDDAMTPKTSSWTPAGELAATFAE